MDVKNNNLTSLKSRYQSILNSLSKCKMVYTEKKEECKSLSEANYKLQQDIDQIRELEKSLRNPLLTSREMINNLQDTVSQLVYLKVAMKKLEDEITEKNNAILALHEDKENLILKHNVHVEEIQRDFKQKLEVADIQHAEQLMQMQHDTDTQLAQFTCVIEELRAKIKEMETEHRQKMNVIIHEYEEKLQKSASEITLLKDQQTDLLARTDANIEAYRRRLEELEEKLKPNQFKQYLVQNSSSVYESPVTVERPYSVNRDSYNNDLETERMVISKPIINTNTQKSSNKMPKLPQVNYHDNIFYNSERKIDKKGAFTISKKRKLFNEKDIID